MENGSLVDYLRSPVEISIHEGLRFAYHASKGLYLFKSDTKNTWYFFIIEIMNSLIKNSYPIKIIKSLKRLL